MVNFFHEIKVYERPIKLTKNMLSPYKNKCRTIAKRKTPEEGHNNTSEKKKKKENTNNPIEKYYSIITD